MKKYLSLKNLAILFIAANLFLLSVLVRAEPQKQQSFRSSYSKLVEGSDGDRPFSEFAQKPKHCSISELQ